MIRGLSVAAALLVAASVVAQNGPVVATGAMRATMTQGRTAGELALDSLARPGMFGLGPLEHLSGELLLWNGLALRSTIGPEGEVVVEDPQARAPFFVHQRVERWTEMALPDSVRDLRTLDAFLTAVRGHDGPPCAFRLEGRADHVEYHVLDVPEGTEVRQPSDAHRHNKHFRMAGDMLALGFFSTRHRTVFTHHDANIHVHAATPTFDRMGHVEEMGFDPGRMRLYVAE